MKASLFLLVLLSTAVPTTVIGQVYIGPLAGAQYSWIKFDESKHNTMYDVSGKPGWHAGANLSMKVRNRFFLHSSVIYATKSREITGKLDGLLTNSVRNDYVEMPIIYAVDFRGRIGNGKEFKYYLGVGPNVSYWLGGKGTIYNSDLAESVDYSGKDMDYRITFVKEGQEPEDGEMAVNDPNRIQLGLNVATGLVLEPLPRQRILLMFRYELGHSFLSRTGSGSFAPTYYQEVLQARNKGLAVSVSYMTDLRIEDRKRGKSTIKPGKMK